MKSSRIPEPGEVYTFIVRELGKYSAVQVLALEGKSLCYVTLDYLEDEPLSPQMLSSMKPLRTDRFRWHRSIAMTWISNARIPRDYIYVGSCAPVTHEPCKSFSGDWDDGMEHFYQARWNAVDEKWRAEYKRCCNSGEQVLLGETAYKKNIGGIRDALYHDLKEGDSLWMFPCATFADINGYSPKLAGLLRTSPFLTTLRLHRPDTEIIDLRGTGLEYLELDVTGVKTLCLPKETRRLELNGQPGPELVIEGDIDGPIDFFCSLGKTALRDFGLPAVRMLRLLDVSELDLEDVARYYPEIEMLSLYGRPGTISTLSALERLRELRWLNWNDIFGYDEAELSVLEALPQLRKLTFDSLPKQAAASMKKRWKNKLDLLEIRRPRAEEWLKENMDNPFRHWDGSEFVPSAAYKSVFKLYRDTRKRFQEADCRETILEAVRQYTTHFNRLNSRYEEFIETEEREDIFRAIGKLHQELIRPKGLISVQELYDAMEDIRDNW